MSIFQAWKRLEQQTIVIKTLWGVIALLTVLNLFLTIELGSAPNKLRLYLPPDITHGALVKPEKIPNSTVYAFAYQIFAALNTWSGSGTTDYQKNIEAYKHYLSNSFYQNLLKDFHLRKITGALSRRRFMSGVSGMGYQPADVKALGNGVWRVNMRLQVTETVGESVVKDVITDYPLKITRIAASIQVNPWDLVISGFEKPPYRIKTIT